jgi:lipopolysaccharide transport periplasmic protein LptA
MRTERLAWAPLWALLLLLASGALHAQTASKATPPRTDQPAAGASAPAASPAPASPSTPATGQSSVRAALAPPTAEQFRPTSPIDIKADRFEARSGDTMIYTGHVQLSSNTLDLSGDRMRVRQLAAGQIEAVITGAPAKLDHPGSGTKNPPAHAEADRITYDSASSEVTLDGHAMFSRGGNQIRGNQIRYNAARHAVDAQGDEQGQVHIVIQPPPASGGIGSALGGAPKGGSAPPPATRTKPAPARSTAAPATPAAPSSSPAPAPASSR